MLAPFASHTLFYFVCPCRLLIEKDIFERYFKIHLSKRLLGAKAISDEAERSVIARLKAECGTAFTYKLEGMFKDIRVSADLMKQFQSKYKAPTGYKFAVRVLTSVSVTIGRPHDNWVWYLAASVVA